MLDAVSAMGTTRTRRQQYYITRGRLPQGRMHHSQVNRRDSVMAGKLTNARLCLRLQLQSTDRFINRTPPALEPQHVALLLGQDTSRPAPATTGSPFRSVNRLSFVMTTRFYDSLLTQTSGFKRLRVRRPGKQEIMKA